MNKLRNKIRNKLLKYTEEFTNPYGGLLVGIYENKFSKFIDEIYKETEINIPKELVMNAINSIPRYKYYGDEFIDYSDLEEVFNAFINENKKYFEEFKTPKVTYVSGQIYENHEEFEKAQFSNYLQNEEDEEEIVDIENEDFDFSYEEDEDGDLLVTLNLEDLTFSNLNKIEKKFNEYDYIMLDVILNKSKSKKTIRVETTDFEEIGNEFLLKEVLFLKDKYSKLEKFASRFDEKCGFIEVDGVEDLTEKIKSCYGNVNIILEIR